MLIKNNELHSSQGFKVAPFTAITQLLSGPVLDIVTFFFFSFLLSPVQSGTATFKAKPSPFAPLLPPVSKCSPLKR